MKSVLWFSRHDMTPEQIDGITRLAGEPVTVHKVDKTVERVTEILDNWQGHDFIAVVLPARLLARLMELKPGPATVIVPVTERDRSAATFTFKHKGWEVIEECRYKATLFV